MTNVKDFVNSMTETLSRAPRTSSDLDGLLVKEAVRLGYAASRLWTYAVDRTAGEKLVLVAHSESVGFPSPRYSTGTDLDYRYSHVENEHSGMYRAIEVDYSDPTGTDQRIDDILDVKGSRVVEIPIQYSGKLYGILALHYPHPESLDQRDLELLTTLGRYIGQVTELLRSSEEALSLIHI